MPGNVYWKDQNGIYQGCNQNFSNFLKLKSPDEIVGKDDFYFLTKLLANYPTNARNIAETVRSTDQRVIQEGKELTEEEVLIDENGKEVIFLSKKLPMKNEQGDIDGLLGISIDITDRIRQEQELKEAKEQAEINNKLKTAFIRDMEHDIRTPFTGVYSLSNSLYEKETDAHKKKLLGYIAISAKELLDYCNTILDFSRIESSTLPVLYKRFNLHQLLRSIISMEKPAAVAKELDLNFQLPPDIPEIVIGDAFRLQRILLNLVGNAIKFTKSGYIKLAAELISIEDKQAIIDFTIEDSGIGIPEHQQNFIFERFTRISPANQGIYPGIGLGLRVVKQFMEELEGEIDIESAPEQGTIFTCTLSFKIPLNLKKASTTRRPLKQVESDSPLKLI
jgi:signal transduction histidine kinase